LYNIKGKEEGMVRERGEVKGRMDKKVEV